MMPLLVAFLVGQNPGQKPPRPKLKTTAVSDTPVTSREVRESFARTIVFLKKGGSLSPGVLNIALSDRPSTRGEVVDEMTKLLKALEPSFRFAPNSVVYDVSKLRIAKSQKAFLETLIREGFVARIGPLAVGPKETLTPEEFGDSLGFFISRASQLSQMPNPKWTPTLQGN